LLAAALIALLGPTSLAAAGPAELSWSAPASCPSESWIHDRLGTLLEAVPGPGARARPRVEASITRRDGLHRLVLTIHDGDHPRVREASAADCTVLAEATALIVATFIDPLPVSAVRGDPTTIAPEIPAAPPSREATIATPLPAARPPSRNDPGELRPSAAVDSAAVDSAAVDSAAPRPDREVIVLAHGIVGRATQPDLDIGGAVGVAWASGPLRLEGAVMALAPRTRPHPSLEGVALRQSLYAASLRGCGGPQGLRWGLALCGGTELGVVVGTGTGVTRPRTTASFWGAAVLGIRARLRITPRGSLWAGPEGVLTYAISSFTVGDATTLAAGTGGIRALAGVQWRVW